jgi:hypothetical protein
MYKGFYFYTDFMSEVAHNRSTGIVLRARTIEFLKYQIDHIV